MKNKIVKIRTESKDIQNTHTQKGQGHLNISCVLYRNLLSVCLSINLCGQ